MPPPCNPLNMPLWALPGTYLHLECGKVGHNITFLPLSLLAKQHGSHHLLQDMLPRFRCKSCGDKPGVMALCEKPYSSCDGMAGFGVGWRVPLRT